jgi:hypothetical protein
MKNIKKIAQEILAMPHILLKNKNFVDLYFEFLEPKERQEFYDDLISPQHPSIKLPDYGKVKDIDISNNIKKITQDDIPQTSENLIEKLVKDKRKTRSPILEYNESQHSYALK